MLDFEDVEKKFRIFHRVDCIWSDKNHLLGPVKTRAVALHKVTFGFILQGKLATSLKILYNI